ncbi:MAG: hypothetical protein AABY19_00455 [Candidatus Thermoplasmatota archaeon]
MAEVLRLGQGGPERARIAVVGCGGAGCNVLAQVPPDLGITRVAANDTVHRSMAGVEARLILPREGLAGVAAIDESLVRQLTSPDEKAIAGAILNHDLVVPIAGLGGDFGGPAAALVGRVTRVLGESSLALVALPFSAEGLHRRALAEQSLDLLSKKVDGVLAFPNDELLRLAPQLPLLRAFQVLGTIMVRPLTDLARASTRTDIGTLRDMLRSGRRWRFGAGEGEGKHRAFAALEEAFSSPWFPGRAEVIERVIVIASAAGFEETLAGEVTHELQLTVPRARILFGGYADGALGERMRLSVLAGW